MTPASFLSPACRHYYSYGDKSCLRTITPGQAARARCAIKCMWRQEC